jgi:hypothetical protein
MEPKRGTTRSNRPATGAPPRPGTGAHAKGEARQTGRRPAAAKPNNLPLILGACGGGGALLLILIVVLATRGGGGGEEARGKGKADGGPAAAAKKAAPPDVSHLEREAKEKCERGKKTIDLESPSLAVAKGEPKEKVMKLVEGGLKDLKEGLEVYRKAAEIGQKTYRLEAYEKAFELGVDRYAKDLEKEATASIEEGLALVKSVEPLMTGTVPEERKPELKEKLQKAIDLISHGNNLRDRVFQVSGRQYEGAREAGQAYKIARSKLLELK